MKKLGHFANGKIPISLRKSHTFGRTIQRQDGRKQGVPSEENSCDRFVFQNISKCSRGMDPFAARAISAAVRFVSRAPATKGIVRAAPEAAEPDDYLTIALGETLN